MHVETHRCREKLFRMVGFHPCCLICKHGVGRCVALVEAISSKFVDQIEQLICPVWRNGMGSAAGDKTFALRVHFGLNLLTHRAAEQICFAKAVSRQYLGGLHNLFLIDEDAVCFVQYRLKQRVRIFDVLFAILASTEHRDVVHWAWAIERYERDNIAEIGRLNRSKRPSHPFGFQLENTDGVAALKQLIHGRVIMRQKPKVNVDPALRQHLCRFLQNGKCLQTQKVELNKACTFDIFHVELCDRHIRTRVAIKWRQFRQFTVADNNTGGVR